MANLRDQSKKNWNSDNGLEAINAGSLQRIADAVEKTASASEKMAGNFLDLQSDRDMYKRWYNEEKDKMAQLRRKYYALKGVVTKLKKCR